MQATHRATHNIAIFVFSAFALGCSANSTTNPQTELDQDLQSGVEVESGIGDSVEPLGSAVSPAPQPVEEAPTANPEPSLDDVFNSVGRVLFGTKESQPNGSEASGDEPERLDEDGS